MQPNYAPQLTAREKNILREVVHYQDGIDRLAAQLLSDLRYYRARLSACSRAGSDHGGLARLYRSHVRHILGLLQTLRAREAGPVLRSLA